MINNKFTIIIGLVISIGVFSLVTLWYVQQKQKTADVSYANNSQIIRYLPLGDSYTIGENVAENERWPNQLAAQYKPNGKQLDIIATPAKTGYTTQDLIDRELPLVKKLKPDFVTILIGVNDYVQGVDAKTFEQNLRYILAQLQKEMTHPHNLVVITIPDYAKTPGGAQFGNPVVATTAIEQFNQIIKDVAAENKLPVADIFAVSQQVTGDPQLIAMDGLHPSAKQYQTWTDIIKLVLKDAGIPR